MATWAEVYQGTSDQPGDDLLTATVYDHTSSGGGGAVSSVTVGTGSAQTGATSVPVAASGVEGVIDLDNVPADDDVETVTGTAVDNTDARNPVVDLPTADEVSYDNSTSSMAATEVQAAVDELDARIDAIPTNLQVPTALDLAGAATAALPTGDAAGVGYIIQNADPAGTALGGANPITVHSGDKVYVAEGVTSSTDDGADFVHFDNTDAVSSVTVGSGLAQAGAVTVPVSAGGTEGVIDLNTVEKTRVHATETLVAPAIPGRATELELQTFVIGQGITDRVVFYNGTDNIFATPTHVGIADGGGFFNLLLQPEGDRVHADDTTVAPASAGAPTIAELEAFAAANSFSGVLYYTGDDLPASAPTYVAHIDGSGVGTMLVEPGVASNLYSGDGTLAGARTVTMDGNDLELVGDNAQRSTLFRHQGLHDALQWRAKQQGFVFGAGTFTPDLTQYGQMTVGIADTDVGDLNVAPPTIDAFEGYADRYEFSVGNTDTVARNVVFDTHYKDNQGNDLGTQVVAPGSYRHWNFHYQGGLLAGSYLDSELVVPSAAVATVIDSSAAPVVETLPAATGSGAIRFYANEDVTNTATLAPASGEQLNGVVDATFLFSNYSSGTQFRADDIATGQWVVSVVGASTQRPINRARMEFVAEDANTVFGANYEAIQVNVGSLSMSALPYTRIKYDTGMTAVLGGWTDNLQATQVIDGTNNTMSFTIPRTGYTRSTSGCQSSPRLRSTTGRSS